MKLNLNQFLTNGVIGISNILGHFYRGNHSGLSYLSGMIPHLEQSAHIRKENERQGLHTPTFLIASIASQCNLHCKGCYARAGGGCGEQAAKQELTAEEWLRIFKESAGLGVSFILLAGGEPLTRRDVIQAAASVPEVVFPIFTNGILIDDSDLAQISTHRNLVPMISLEGNDADTDARRGAGVAEKVNAVMQRLQNAGILFGCTVTVTTENLETVIRPEYMKELQKKGCGGVIFVEYVPAEKGTEALVLSPEELSHMNRSTQALKKKFPGMVILSFPGDEEAMGGCLASGRGFFHINQAGGCEPCPFSPHSVHNLKEQSMREVLESDYFEKLRMIAAQAGPHTGGCVLFRCEEEVAAVTGQCTSPSEVEPLF